jgi:hypothetical protein
MRREASLGSFPYRKERRRRRKEGAMSAETLGSRKTERYNSKRKKIKYLRGISRIVYPRGMRGTRPVQGAYLEVVLNLQVDDPKCETATLDSGL